MHGFEIPLVLPSMTIEEVFIHVFGTLIWLWLWGLEVNLMYLLLLLCLEIVLIRLRLLGRSSGLILIIRGLKMSGIVLVILRLHSTIQNIIIKLLYLPSSNLYLIQTYFINQFFFIILIIYFYLLFN